MKNLIGDVRRTLDAGQAVVLATVVGSTGSTPRSAGARMAVCRDKTIIGSVGGGATEAEACCRALDMFAAQPEATALLDLDLKNDPAAAKDAGPGDRLSLLLELALPGSSAGRVVAELDDLLRQGLGAVLVLVLGNRDQEALARAVVKRAADLAPGFPLRAQAAEAVDQACDGGTALLRREGLTILAQAFAPPPTLFLFGAGHVARATAAVAGSVGFRVVVVDDRPEFATAERFPDADQILVLASFAEVLAKIEIGPQAFAAIMTRSHAHDKTVLGQVLATPARYVGMIGSGKKRRAIYNALRDQGLGEEALARCHCPIGLAIGARTPEEIAVSIVAEVLAVRAGVRA
ncbi:MAG: XdhC family protein [Desulfovibrionaceae bacterium]|nr:XdhC family protein [Desulfovibrionaceae bacterium]